MTGFDVLFHYQTIIMTSDVESNANLSQTHCTVHITHLPIQVAIKALLPTANNRLSFNLYYIHVYIFSIRTVILLNNTF